MDKSLEELRREEGIFASLLEASDPALKVGDWNVRELVCHLLGWDLTTLAALQQALAEVSPAMIPEDRGDRFNQAAGTLWFNASWEGLKDYYKATSAWLFHIYKWLSAQEALPLANLPADPIGDDLLHYREHVEELRRALETR